MTGNASREYAELMPSSKATATAFDVAREAGVSQSAVSRAFTPGASIAAETRERIITAAQKLGYRPNPLARALLHGRSNIVGIGVGDLGNPFFVQTLQLLSDALHAANLQMLLFPAGQSARPEPSIHDVLHYRLDALVLLSVSPSSRLADQCRRAQVPVIHFNRRTTAESASFVVGDNLGGARSIAAHLLAGGHRRLAFMAGTPESSTNAERQAGFLGFLAEREVDAPLLECGHYSADESMAATRRLLQRTEPPDAIFCANDTMALAAITVARHEFGLDVGREISIAGFDDVPMAAWPGFSLTSYSQPAPFMVAETLRLIHALRANPDMHEQVLSEGALVVRSSTRPVLVR